MDLMNWTCAGETRFRRHGGVNRIRCFAYVGWAALIIVAGCRPGRETAPAVVSTASEEEPRRNSGERPWFVDVAGSSGLDFVHDAGEVDGAYFLPQILGSGAAVFDFDGDGRMDLYLVQNGGPGSAPNRLYRCLEDGHFVDVTAGSGLDIAAFGMGAAAGDVNNDGRTDLYLTSFGADRLMRNDGNGTFTDVTADAGLDNSLWGTSASFLDFDRDGRLDIVVANYLAYDPTWQCRLTNGRREYCHPKRFPGAVTRLFHNQTDPGSRSVAFADVTIVSGLGRLDSRGLGITCADFDGDGWPDIFVANDAGPNRLWINRHDGTFEDEALIRGIAYDVDGRAAGNMGIGWGDVDGDGAADLLVTHLTDETHTLWRQVSRGQFQDRSAAFGLRSSTMRGTGFGVAVADFDLDGWLDAAVVHGRVSQGASGHEGPHWSRYAERNQLFGGDGAGRLLDISDSNEPFCRTPGVFRGLALVDFDDDGALDLLVTEAAGPVRLFRNVAPRRGHWLSIRAYDPQWRRDALGAVVTVSAGARSWIRHVLPGQSYLCSNEPRAHFGLGDAADVDDVRVVWPDGAVEAFDAPQVDRAISLVRGSGRIPSDDR
jgi:hypothetical protein